jgi:hypothetical protein
VLFGGRPLLFAGPCKASIARVRRSRSVIRREMIWSIGITRDPNTSSMRRAFPAGEISSTRVTPFSQKPGTRRKNTTAAMIKPSTKAIRRYGRSASSQFRWTFSPDNRAPQAAHRPSCPGFTLWHAEHFCTMTRYCSPFKLQIRSRRNVVRTRPGAKELPRRKEIP